MQDEGRNEHAGRWPKRAKKPADIWLAGLVALALHALFIILPVSMTRHHESAVPGIVEVRLHKPAAVAPAREPEALTQPPPLAGAKLPDEPEPLPPEDTPTAADKSTVVKQADTPAIQAQTEQPDAAGQEQRQDPTQMSEADRARLADRLLIRQFITEASVTEKLFGKGPEQAPAHSDRSFYYPVRQDMIAMLDRPLPEMPFGYTPGLVHFAYEPGVRGDLQRFWDTITPEFGWRTDNALEVRCKWVLVIAACGWKRH